jgi:hypothetical protein
MYIKGSVDGEAWNCIHFLMRTSVLRDIIAAHIDWQEYGEI